LHWQATTHRLLVNGRPVDPARTYQIALLDHHLFIPFFPTLNISGKTTILADQLLRTVVGNYLATQYPTQG